MTISLTLDSAHVALVHVLCESHYHTMMTTADIFERTARRDGAFDDLAREVVKGFREEAESARRLGQMIEALSPLLDPADWSWPRR